jgi:glycosyltransferase involved in cell wall biosynthesis
MKRVSVAVSTFNRAARLPGLVAALEAQTLPRDDFEVVIADNASVDETPTVLKELSARSSINLRVVRTDVNRGPAPARNLAWRQSDAPVIAFTDDDCQPAPRWLEAGLAWLDGTPDVVQGRTMPDPATPIGRWAVTQTIESFTYRFETCNIFYRTELLERLGGFDENMPFFGEDTVLGWSALRLGVAADFAPDALVHHAVNHPGIAYHWRWAQQHGNWATMVRRFPEMRSKMLWAGLFTKRRHAAFVSAVAGLVAGTAWRPALALTLPYLWYRRPRYYSREELVDHILGTAFDAAVVTGLLRGSIRERTLVL